MAKVNVKQNEENVLPNEILAESITRISDGIARLNKNGINRKGVLVLLSHSCQMPQSRVAKVLDALEDLKKDYCK